MISKKDQPDPFTKNIIQNVALSRTLLAEESDSLCLFDSTEGITYTLPPPAAGMTFYFCVTVSVLAPNVYKTITDASTSLLSGAIVLADLTSPDLAYYFSPNGASDVAIENNGTTTGGLLGGIYQLTALSTTSWFVDGVTHASGVKTSPFRSP